MGCGPSSEPSVVEPLGPDYKVCYVITVYKKSKCVTPYHNQKKPSILGHKKFKF